MSIGIVIPVYNVEKYLRKCLDSVCAQSDCVTEIILVNDGSTDNSLSICQEYALKDKRIKIISQENKGLPVAVRVGVKASTCDYIGFVDSDDYVETDMFATLAEAIEQTGADIAVCHYDVEDENYKFVRKSDLGIEKGVYTKKDGQFPVKLLPLLRDRNFISASRWNKLTARKLLVENIAFQKAEVAIGEDLTLMIPVAMSADKIVCVDKCLYHYILRSKSLMHSYSKRNLPDWDKSVEILKNTSQIYGYKFDNFGDSALALLLSNCLVPLRRADMPRAQKKKEFKAIGNNPTARKFLREVKVKTEFKKKILFKLLKYKLYGLLSLVYK